MEKKNIDPLQSKRLHQLMAEVEGLPQGSRQAGEETAQASSPVLVGLRRCVFGLFFLGIGFWVGSYATEQRLSLQPPSELQSLVSQGWRQDGTGIAYRWCQRDCHAPQLYGGGILRVFEVKCVDRPCGEIFLKFNVLNAKGEIVDQISVREKGIRGETRRFLIESERPDAASLELSEFSARARV